MAILSDQDRFDVWASVMRLERIEAAIGSIPGDLSKTDLRAAVNAVDQWVSDNASAFNLAIPLPARTSLTASQKAALLVYVVAKRYVKGV